MGVWDSEFGDLLRDGEEGVEAFGDGPGEAFAFGFVLDVTGGHVDGENVGLE